MKCSMFLLFVIFAGVSSYCYSPARYELRCENALPDRIYPSVRVLHLTNVIFTIRQMDFFPRLKIIKTDDFLSEICQNVGDRVTVIGCDDNQRDDSRGVDNSVDNSAQVDQSAEDVASIVVDVIALLISITSLTVAGVMLKLYRKLTRTVMANDQVTCESVASFATEFRSSTPIQMGRSDENMNTYLEPRVYASLPDVSVIPGDARCPEINEHNRTYVNENTVPKQMYANDQARSNTEPIDTTVIQVENKAGSDNAPLDPIDTGDKLDTLIQGHAPDNDHDAAGTEPQHDPTCTITHNETDNDIQAAYTNLQRDQTCTIEQTAEGVLGASGGGSMEQVVAGVAMKHDLQATEESGFVSDYLSIRKSTRHVQAPNRFSPK